jgi:hypothetical protein
MLSNAHAAIHNADVKAPTRWAILHRGEDPGAGASTMYHGAHFTAAKDVEAGSELFVQYVDVCSLMVPSLSFYESHLRLFAYGQIRHEVFC